VDLHSAQAALAGQETLPAHLADRRVLRPSPLRCHQPFQLCTTGCEEMPKLLPFYGNFQKKLSPACRRVSREQGSWVQAHASPFSPTMTACPRAETPGEDRRACEGGLPPSHTYLPPPTQRTCAGLARSDRARGTTGTRGLSRPHAPHAQTDAAACEASLSCRGGGTARLSGLRPNPHWRCKAKRSYPTA